MKEMRKFLFLLPAAAAVAAVSGRLMADVPLTGGAFSVDVLVSASGGEAASGGAMLLSAPNLGGPVFTGSVLTGGAFSLEAGAAAAAIPAETAKAGLGGAHCYPVPFKPSAGHTKITFTDLTRSARILIYTMSGQLVRTLEKSDAGDSLGWDVKNSRGESLASGVYVFVVKSATQTASGKLMIIR